MNALLALIAIPLSLASATAPAKGTPQQAELASLERRQAQFAPVALEADLSRLSEGDRKALDKLVEAARIMDSLYLRQVWAGNETMLLALQNDQTPVGRARLRYFLTQKGPWDRQDGNKPFIPGAPHKPAGANFYPADAAKDEIERWIGGLAESEKEAATGFFTVVKRSAAGLTSVPYSLEYQNELLEAGRLLREAAALTSAPTLKTFLDKRAAAFLSNNYYDSDVAWMELDAPIEPTIGPYETYEDEWFSYKASFEAFIGLRDDAETDKLRKFSSELQWLEDRLPIEPAYRNPSLGALAPIRVINELYASGDAARGVRTAAFNLPNDEKVTREKGAKRTMIKNVQEAKFKIVLTPLAKLALPKADQSRVDFDSFFTHILMHELMHGLGPHAVQAGAEKGATVRKALKDTSSALEEAKADVAGLWALQQLIDKGVLPQEMERTMYVTFLASAFRTLRFGITEAHGKGMALQLNWLLDQGAVTVGPDGRFSVVESKVKEAVAGLSREIMEIQARGDYSAAKSLLERLAVLRPEAKAVIDLAAALPVDIQPQ